MEERPSSDLPLCGRLFLSAVRRGCQRVVFDGLEPAERFSESIQFEFFEYIYHHVLRKEDEWAAREWLREKYRAFEDAVLSHRYDQSRIGCLYLYTTPQVMLEELLVQPISQGDIFANANTIILMGRTRHNGEVGPGALRHQAPRQHLRRGDPAVSDHGGRVRLRLKIHASLCRGIPGAAEPREAAEPRKQNPHRFRYFRILPCL